jgi:peptidoglycan/xylan/chitin deacetylase (PgdA/CDA1 family)
MGPDTNKAGRGPDLPGLLRHLGRRALGRLGCGLSRVLGPLAGDSFGILTYHRVTPWGGRRPAPTWNVTPRRLRAQLAGLLGRGYRPVHLREALTSSREGRPLPARAFVVTFDDGYEGVYRHAWPILRDLGVPATVFLATAYLDGDEPFPFEDWRLAGSPRVSPDSWRPLTTAQCAALFEGGLIDVGSHTHTHRMFRGRPEALYEDVLTSAGVLRRRFGLADATFSFPFGIVDAELTAAARRAGMLCALSTQEVLVRPGSDPFTWGRFGVTDTETAAALAGRLDGWHSLARGAWLRWRWPGGAPVGGGRSA